MDFEDDEEWELCNDDGFVYKRKRRRIDPPPPPADLDLDQEKRRRERKKQTLLKLKSKYEKEILQWESLSNTLNSMQQKSLQVQPPPPPPPPSQTSSLPSSSDSAGGSLLDDLLNQVEFQEAIIHDISNLCDVAEAICDKREEQLKQSLFDLPIWGSPLELMQVLCECDD